MSTVILEQRLRSDPDDRDAWAVLGDRLQEAGDPAGELIALSQHPTPHPRTEELRALLLEPLASFIADGALEITWRHGVPHRASVRRSGSALAALAGLPIARFLRELALTEVTDDVAGVLDRGFFTGLCHLDLDAFDREGGAARLGNDELRAFAASSRLMQLEALSLGGQQIGDVGVDELLRAPLPSLRRLSLVDDRIGERGVAALANSEHLPSLRALNLHYNHFEDAGLAQLVDSRHLALRELVLGMNRLSEVALRLAASPMLATVETLVLNMDELGEGGVEALARSPYARRLTSLTLASCDVDANGARSLAASPLLRKLTALELPSNEVGDDGAIALTSVPSQLRHLNLEFNGLTDGGLMALAACPHLATLDELWIWGSGEQEARGLEAMLASPYLSTAVKRSIAYQFGAGPDPATP